MILLHTADLHLDSPIRMSSDYRKSEIRRQEILQTFGRIVDLAVQRGAEAVLIAGDLFDRENRTRRTVAYVTDQIAAHPQIQFYYLRGNHDRSNGTDQLPDLPNLCLFGNSLTKVSLSEQVDLYASEDPSALAFAEPFDPMKVNIGMLHGDVTNFAADLGDERKSVPLSQFAGLHLDYLALGHFHSYGEFPVDERGIACYSGCPNGRGFDECGEKGVVLLTIRNGGVEREFVPMSDRVYHERTVEISDEDDFSLLRRAVEDIPTTDALRLVLTGQRSEANPLDLRMVADALPPFFGLRLIDQTAAVCSEETMAEEISLRGEFIRRVRASELSEEEKRQVIRCGLAALRGEAPSF